MWFGTYRFIRLNDGWHQQTILILFARGPLPAAYKQPMAVILEKSFEHPTGPSGNWQ